MKYVIKFIQFVMLIVLLYNCEGKKDNKTEVSSSKIKINELLKAELAEIYKRDQGFRMVSAGGISEEKRKEWFKILKLDKAYFEANERRLFKENDSLNLIEIEKIISKYGYPGKSLVGEPENDAAWYVIQHSNKIEKYFPIIEAAGKKGELLMTKVATMQDRMLMNQGKEQIYGTQGKGIFIVENPTKQEDMIHIIWPIKDLDRVNQLRERVGFSTTVEENAKRLGIDYKVYTLDDVKKMKKAD